MGDNRDRSSDSRGGALVNIDNVLGTAWLIFNSHDACGGQSRWTLATIQVGRSAS